MITGLDWVNPVLLREYQQVVRSRVFAWVGVLWLLAQLLISLIFISMLEPTEAGLSLTGPGGQYFSCVIGGLAALFLLVLPVSTFNRVVRDRKEATLELLTISRIGPLQIVFGFLLVTFAQVALFVFMSFPFVVFAYLFRGLDLVTVFWSVYFLVLLALVANSVTLTIASFCRTTRITAAVRVLFGVGMVFVALPAAWSVLAAMMFMRHGRGFGFGSIPDLPWLAVGLLTLGALLVVGLSVVFARSNLLFEAANRTSLPRLCVTAVFVIAGVIVNAFAWTPATSADEYVYVFDVLSFLGLLVYSAWILGESNEISRRMRESFPKHPFLRWLGWPYLPGRGTAMVYLIVNGLLLAGLCFTAYIGSKADLSDSEFVLGSLLKPYSLFPIGCAMLVQHLVRRTRFSRVYFIGWLLIVGSLIMWVPLLWGTRPFDQFEVFIMGSINSTSTLYWRGLVAPLLGIVMAYPAVRENWRNLRQPPAPAAEPPVIKS